MKYNNTFVHHRNSVSYIYRNDTGIIGFVGKK